MPIRTRPGKAFQLYLSDEEWAWLSALAAANGRAVATEIRDALARYREAPNRIVRVPEPPPPPKQPPGRPKKNRKEIPNRP